MAKSHVFVISILLMALLSPPSQSHGLTILGYFIRGVVIDVAVLSEALTDINGLFRIALSYFETILFNPSFCGFGFTLPAGTCGIAAPDTVLSTPLNLVGLIDNNNINIALYTANLFINSTG
ncbi:hypothetical protein IGI04_026743 [Brassica rapa subsp. trilocularis]|uniref:Uncharacterized protein n=1 Tax=Brassica rapa subsp. trilocularis TaxID=1813537 RepID=A0ABQ7KXE2_BRACM|nr:hypothetical protein IGI04_026743 [Brassica rapa subsp. trilocularis]